MVKHNTAPHNEKRLFVKGTAYLTHFVLCVFLSLTILVLDHKYQKLESMRTGLNTALYPVYYISDLSSQFTYWLQERFVPRGNLLTDNKRLRTKNLVLSQKLQKHQMLEVENQRLRNLLNMSKQYSHDKVQIASVLRLDQNKDNNKLTLDKGLKDGVYIGQPVLDDKGLLGQIVHVSYQTSTLLLLDSVRHFTPIQVVRNAYHSIAAGAGALLPLHLSRVKEGTDIKEGDVLVTSGMGGLFPAGYKVGTVIAVSNKIDHFLEVEIDSFSAHEKVTEVLLIWPTTKTNTLLGNHNVE